MNKERFMAIIRIVALFITAFNAIFVAAGKAPIPFDESAFYEGASYLVAAIVAVWNWWKNNNITVEAQTGQQLTNQLKADRKKAGGEKSENNPVSHEIGDPADPEVE